MYQTYAELYAYGPWAILVRNEETQERVAEWGEVGAGDLVEVVGYLVKLSIARTFGYIDAYFAFKSCRCKEFGLCRLAPAQERDQGRPGIFLVWNQKGTSWSSLKTYRFLKLFEKLVGARFLIGAGMALHNRERCQYGCEVLRRHCGSRHNHTKSGGEGFMREDRVE